MESTLPGIVYAISRLTPIRRSGKKASIRRLNRLLPPSSHHAPVPSNDPGDQFQAKLRQKRRKETQLELERVRALEEKAEVRVHGNGWGEVDSGGFVLIFNLFIVDRRPGTPAGLIGKRADSMCVPWPPGENMDKW